YFGVLSSHSSRRSQVVPRSTRDPARSQPPAAPGDQLELPGLAADPTGDVEDRPADRNRWAWLLRHVFLADLDTCPKCGGAMRWLEVALPRAAIARVMAKHGLAPPPSPADVSPSTGTAPAAISRLTDAARVFSVATGPHPSVRKPAFPSPH